MQKRIQHKHKIIELLKIKPNHRSYLREIARELNLDPGNLSRELKTLVNQNILKKETEGTLTYFSLIPEKDRSPFKKTDLDKYLKTIEPELIKFCQNIIRTPSVSGENPEEKIAELIAKKAKEFRLSCQVEAKDKQRPNLVIELGERKDRQKPTFLFLGHMDTIGPGEIENWHYYPFSGHIASNRIYGRGATDMKAGIACELFLLKAIKDLELDLPVNPRILLVSNEEGGAKATKVFNVGMEHLIEQGHVEGIGAIYGYGGSWNVGIGHRGVLRVKITVKGKAMHTGSLKHQRDEIGSNAVTSMAEILLALEKFKIPETTHLSFPRHGNVITPGTMILHGGTAVSTVPDLCESVVEVRYLPGLEIRHVYHQLKTLIESVAQKRNTRAECEIFVDIPAVSLSPEEKIVEITQQACKDVYGESISALGTGPANESFMLIKKGIPTVVFGPRGGKPHADNEYAETPSLIKTIKVYLQVLQQIAS